MSSTHTPETLKDIVIIYHKHCQDGFGGAFAAYKKFGDTASYIGWSDRLLPPEGLIDKELFIVDFSFPEDVLLDLEKKNKRCMVIDHHASAKEAVESLKEHIFTVEHSGAYLAWQYFVNNEVPWLIQVLEIIDMAKDKSHHHADIIAYILSKDLTFENYEELLNDFNDEAKMVKIKEIGKALNDSLQLLVTSLVNEPDFIEFEGYTVPCVNFFLPINPRSMALAYLYEKYPPFAMSYRYDDGFIKFSLRGNGEIDLSVLAQKYGGGGHPVSCGFVVDWNQPFPFKRVIPGNKE